MALDGTQDTIICGLPEIDISGSTSVSSAFRNDCIIFKFQQMSQYDENGVLESPYPSYYYKLNLLNNTMTAFSDKQNSDANQIEDIAEKFAQAYFSKDLTGVSAYLDDGTEPETYAENIWTDSSDFRLKWTPEIILSSENAISVQIEFALPGNDSYDYLDLSFSSNSGQWKINSFGLEK
ncbi:hypothetical protein SDC9_175617 [bioreactor metagenome]|uniref:Uncharacterized protein n=1 Tax=bioreactor metagenome TaxID=1076179 RepID=A0A645GMN7_9ZZZZ